MPTPSSAAATTDAQAPLVAALTLLLRPIARLMLARNLNYSFVAELLKQVMVDVADREFVIPEKPQTDSRISLLTGIHRKDVKRLRELRANVADEPPAAPTSIGAQLIAMWISTAPFADRSGRPRPLPRLASAGGSTSFEELVESISTDIRSRAVLDELLRQGLVTLDAEDQVVLNRDAFIPEQGAAEKLQYLGQNLHDHAATAVRNVLGGEPPFIERSVYYGGLARDSIDQLEALSAAEGMKALKAINRKAAELDRRDAKRQGPKARFRFGIYFYSADDEAER